MMSNCTNGTKLTQRISFNGKRVDLRNANWKTILAMLFMSVAFFGVGIALVLLCLSGPEELFPVSRWMALLASSLFVVGGFFPLIAMAIETWGERPMLVLARATIMLIVGSCFTIVVNWLAFAIIWEGGIWAMIPFLIYFVTSLAIDLAFYGIVCHFYASVRNVFSTSTD